MIGHCGTVGMVKQREGREPAGGADGAETGAADETEAAGEDEGEDEGEDKGEDEGVEVAEGMGAAIEGGAAIAKRSGIGSRPEAGGRSAPTDEPSSLAALRIEAISRCDSALGSGGFDGGAGLAMAAIVFRIEVKRQRV
jgi:hypothetical protein